MLEIFSAVLGFAAPFLPELLKYFNRKQDNAHELEMMKLQIEKDLLKMLESQYGMNLILVNKRYKIHIEALD